MQALSQVQGIEQGIQAVIQSYIDWVVAYPDFAAFFMLRIIQFKVVTSKGVTAVESAAQSGIKTMAGSTDRCQSITSCSLRTAYVIDHWTH